MQSAVLDPLWIPAFAGKTDGKGCRRFSISRFGRLVERRHRGTAPEGRALVRACLSDPE